MKKTLFAAASLMMFAACSNTDDVQQNDKVTDEGRLVTVTTTLPGDTPDSRVVLTEENPDTDNRKIKVEWEDSGETFSVMTATSTATQTFTQTEGSDFEGTLTDGWTQPYYAFYPVTSATNATNATAVPYDLSTQTGALSETTNYMYAVNTTDGKEYNFQHLNAIVKFTLNLPSGYTPTSLSLVSDRLLAKGTVNLTGESVAYTNELSAHSITVENPTVVDGKITLYLHVSPMAASDDSKNTLHIRTHSGSKGYSGSISTSKEIKAGKYYTATVDVTTHDYDYTSSTNTYTVHSPWGLRAWGENTSNEEKCVLGNNDIDMGTLPNDIEMVGFAGNWTTTNKSGANQMFDGNNKTISNLRVVGGYQSYDDTYVGFIGRLGGNATFKDVTFKGSTVAVVSGKYTYAGIAMGTTTGISGTVSGVTIEPNPDSTEPVYRISVSDSSNDRITLGAVIGYTGMNQIVKNCINNQDLAVTGINDDNTITCYWLMIGGISGFANKGDLFLQCVNNGNIELKDATTKSQKLIGGVVGMMGGGIFVACANTGSVTAPKDYVISGIGYSPNYANYGCYSANHAVTAKLTYGSFNGFYDSVSTNLAGVTKVTEFNTDEVVNGMNNALATYNNTADLDDTKKCDKHWEKSADTNYPYPVLVEGAPTATTE